MPSIHPIFVFFVISVAVSALADASGRHQYCGKKLLRHVAVVCRATDCDANGQDMSVESAESALSGKLSKYCSKHDLFE